MGTYLDRSSENSYFMVDANAAHEILGLKNALSSEDFQLYSADEYQQRGANGNLDTRGETLNGRRIGLRTLNRETPKSLHPLLTVWMFIICGLHLFSRSLEKVIYDSGNLLMSFGAEGVFSNEMRDGHLCK